MRAPVIRASEAGALQRALVEAAAVLLGATLLVCLLFWHMVVAIGSTVIGFGDAPGTVAWLYALQHEGGYHLFGQTHHTLTGAPFGWDGDNGLNIQWLLPYYPMYIAAKVLGPVTAHNLTLLTGFVLSGAAMYLLVRYLGCGRLVAAWAGLVYIVFPWHLARAVHASLVHLEFLPLLLLAVVAATRKPTVRRFALVAAATAACWLTSGYFGAMAVVAAIAFGLGAALAGRGLRLLVGATAAVVAGSLAVAVVSELAGVGRGVGLHRAAHDLAPWGLYPVELVVPAARNFVFRDWTGPFYATRQHHSYYVETTNYLGWLTIALALVWLVVAWRRRAALDRFITAGLAVVAVVALLLAFPSPVSVLGHDIPMPSRLVWQIVPPFRVPARWSALLMTALVPLAALGLQAVAARVRARWRGFSLAPAVVVAAMVVSFLELAFDPARSRLSTTDVPPEYTAVKQHVPDGIVAEYPMGPQIEYFFWQTEHGHPLLNTDAFGTPADDVQRAVVNPSSPGVAEQFALLGVRGIVTHPGALRWSPAPFPPNPESWGPGYKLVGRSDDGSSTWLVTAKPAPALISAVAGFSTPVPLDDALPGYALTSSSGVAYFTIRAKQPTVAQLSFDAEAPGGKSQVLRLADSSNERRVALRGLTHVSLPVAIPRGFSLVLVKTDPAATSLEDAIMLSKIRLEATTEQPQLNAVLESDDPGF